MTYTRYNIMRCSGPAFTMHDDYRNPGNVFGFSYASCSQQSVCLQALDQVATGHTDVLLADLYNYLCGIGKDVLVAADVSALVGSMVHSDVEYRATAQQALQSLQLLAPSNKAEGKGTAVAAAI